MFYDHKIFCLNKIIINKELCCNNGKNRNFSQYCIRNYNENNDKGINIVILLEITGQLAIHILPNILNVIILFPILF